VYSDFHVSAKVKGESHANALSCTSKSYSDCVFIVIRYSPWLHLLTTDNDRRSRVQWFTLALKVTRSHVNLI